MMAGTVMCVITNAEISLVKLDVFLPLLVTETL